MFFIFNKQKIYSYAIAASTVVVLFILSFFFINTDMEAKETSINTVNKILFTNKQNNTNNVILNNYDNIGYNIQYSVVIFQIKLQKLLEGKEEYSGIYWRYF